MSVLNEAACQCKIRPSEIFYITSVHKIILFLSVTSNVVGHQFSSIGFFTTK